MEEIKELPPLPEENYRPHKRRRDIDPKIVLLAVETIVVIVLAVTVMMLIDALKADEEYLSAESSRVFEYYGEKDVIRLDDAEYGDIWLEAVTDMPRHKLDYDKMKTENGFKNYYIDGVRQTKTGIDVSYHQGNIDWEAVKNDGVEFAMLRVGYRGYESGKINTDERFHEYAQNALAAGLDIGVYFYSQAVTPEEAEEEAQFVLGEIDGYDIMYPVVFDWEFTGDKSARTDKLPSDTLNECASVFCNTIARGGYIPMVYSVKRMALMKLDLSRLSGFDFWLAEYRERPEFPYEFKIWQYASDGRVAGIEGDVDLDMSFVDYSKVRR